MTRRGLIALLGIAVLSFVVLVAVAGMRDDDRLSAPSDSEVPFAEVPGGAGGLPRSRSASIPRMTRAPRQAWLRRLQLPGNIHYLIGSREQLEPVWHAYFAAPQPLGGARAGTRPASG